MITPVGNWKVEPSLKVVEVAPLPPVVRGIEVPLFRFALTPPVDDNETEVTVPDAEPSAELIVWPISNSACVSAEDVSIVSSFEFVWICCSTEENDAS